jgi:hypothetical protein
MHFGEGNMVFFKKKKEYEVIRRPELPRQILRHIRPPDLEK